MAPRDLACLLAVRLGSAALSVLRALLQALRDAVSPTLYSYWRGHRQRNRFLGRFSDLILGSYRALDFHLSNYKLTSKDSLDNPMCGVV